MSDERKEWLLKHIDYVFSGCRMYGEQHDCKCSKCPKGKEACNQAYTELKRLIQQKPEKYFVIIKIKEYGEVTKEIRHYDTKGEAEAWVNKLRIAGKNKYCGFEILETFFYEGRVI